MVDAYLDESGIHDGAKICVIAGYFGNAWQLRKFENVWKKTLADFEFPMKDFHATNLLKKKIHHPMLRELARITGQHKKVIPVTWAIVVDDFNSFSLEQRKFMTGATLDPKSGKLVTSGCPNKPYFVPFQQVLKVVTTATPKGSKAHFNFGTDKHFSKYAMTLFKQIVETTHKFRPFSSWKSRDRLGNALFPLASETAQLQAADLLVHLSYRMMDDWRATGKTGGSSPFIYELLKLCLANMRHKLDHVYQDKALLQKLIVQAKKYVPTWNDM